MHCQFKNWSTQQFGKFELIRTDVNHYSENHPLWRHHYSASWVLQRANGNQTLINVLSFIFPPTFRGENRRGCSKDPTKTTQHASNGVEGFQHKGGKNLRIFGLRSSRLALTEPKAQGESSIVVTWWASRLGLLKWVIQFCFLWLIFCRFWQVLAQAHGHEGWIVKVCCLLLLSRENIVIKGWFSSF